MNLCTNFNKTSRLLTQDEHLQQFTFQNPPNSTWLPKRSELSQHINDYNLVNLTDIELKLGVAVAEMFHSTYRECEAIT